MSYIFTKWFYIVLIDKFFLLFYLWSTFDALCRSIPVYFRWLSYLSWFSYGNEIL